LNIAIITSMKYGLSQFIYRDIVALEQKGHNITLFTVRNTKGLYNPLPSWNVISVTWLQIILSQFHFGIRHPARYWQLLATALSTNSIIDLLFGVAFAEQTGDCEVMYAYFGDHKLFIGYYCKLITNIPLIVSIRAYELHNNPNPVMFTKAIHACDYVVTISNYNRDYLIDHFNIPANRIEVVRQILDLNEYQSKPKMTILIVGFFSEKKGHEILFKAYQKLSRDDIELWVVGDATPDVTPVDCRKLAKDLGIEKQVAFFGVQEGVALRALYRQCDIFCLPSRTASDGDKEGFPNVIAEAMAFGKPVVTTRHAGIPEVVDAILVDENNVDQLAQALNEACSSAALRTELGVRNRAKIERLFSPDNNDRLEAILSQFSRQHTYVAAPSAEISIVEGGG
jgi:colanic acid/amylovoran biosynthesis glycosyltransferase